MCKYIILGRYRNWIENIDGMELRDYGIVKQPALWHQDPGREPGISKEGGGLTTSRGENFRGDGGFCCGLQIRIGGG